MWQELLFLGLVWKMSVEGLFVGQELVPTQLLVVVGPAAAAQLVPEVRVAPALALGPLMLAMKQGRQVVLPFRHHRHHHRRLELLSLCSFLRALGSPFLS